MKTRTKILISIGVLYIFGALGWFVFDGYQVQVFTLFGAISLYMLIVYFLVIIGIEVWSK